MTFRAGARHSPDDLPPRRPPIRTTDLPQGATEATAAVAAATAGDEAAFQPRVFSRLDLPQELEAP
jgi:hypothetical protein